MLSGVLNAYNKCNSRIYVNVYFPVSHEFTPFYFKIVTFSSNYILNWFPIMLKVTSICACSFKTCQRCHVATDNTVGTHHMLPVRP